MAVWEGGASHLSPGLEADAVPGTAEPAAPDLQLGPEESARAGALSAFADAMIAEDSADADTALDDYQKALALDPAYTELAVKVAFELVRRGDPSGAVQVLKDNIKAAPKAALAYLYLSQIYERNLGKPEAGLKYAEQALELNPGNFPAYMGVYDVEMTLGQPQKAAEVLERARKTGNPDPQFWVQLGDAMLKPLLHVEGMQHAEIPKTELEKISGVYDKALALAGNDPAMLAHVADFHASVHEEAAAIPLYLKALKFSPANPVEGDPTLGDVTENLAKCFAAVGRNAEAIATLKQLIKDNPLRYEAYGLLCDLYDKSGDDEAAIAVCQQMLLLDQSDFRNYLTLADLDLKQKRAAAAIATLTDARTRFPNEARVTTFLGFALAEAKRFREAMGVFEEAQQEAAEGETSLLDAQFYFTYGAAAEQAGEVDKAADLLKKAIDLDPDNAAEPQNYLGFMWVDRNMHMEEAGGLIRKALKADPTNPAYIDSMGWYYFKKGDFKQALENLKRAAVTIHPEDPQVDEHVGDAYSASGDTAAALDYWQKAAALDRDNRELGVKIAGAREKLARQPAPSPAVARP